MIPIKNFFNTQGKSSLSKSNDKANSKSLTNVANKSIKDFFGPAKSIVSNNNKAVESKLKLGEKRGLNEEDLLYSRPNKNDDLSVETFNKISKINTDDDCKSNQKNSIVKSIKNSPRGFKEETFKGKLNTYSFGDNSGDLDSNEKALKEKNVSSFNINDIKTNDKIPKTRCNSNKTNKRNKVIDDSSFISENFEEDDDADVDDTSFQESSFISDRKNKNKANKKSVTTKTTTNNKDNQDKNEISKDNDMTSSLNIFANPEKYLPKFLLFENIKDKDKNSPNDDAYDPTSLYIPESFIENETPSMTQYWEFKTYNFDKIILFKLGKFYEMFYDDAIIGNQVLGLKWMGDNPAKKLHVGFPETMLQDKANILIENGFKVAVIEQTEKASDLEIRLKNQKPEFVAKLKGKEKKLNKLAKRELSNIYTKSSLNNINDYRNNFCFFISYFEERVDNINDINKEEEIKEMTIHKYGLVICDLSNNKYYIKEIKGSMIHNKHETNYSNYQDVFTQLCGFLYKHEPKEIVFFRNKVPGDLVNFASKLSSKPQISMLKNTYDILKCEQLIKNNFENKSGINNLSKLMNFVSRDYERNEHILSSIYLSIIYLEQILVAEKYFPICVVKDLITVDITNNDKSNCKYNENEIESNTQKMILDFLTITKLEILETKLDISKPTDGSLLEYFNQAVTKQGKRKLTTWLLNPLMDLDLINQRLNSIEIFADNFSLLKDIRSKLAKIPDIEKLINKIYQFSVKTTSKAVYFNNVSRNKLKDFINLTDNLVYCVSVLESLSTIEEYSNNTTFDRNNKKENDIYNHNLIIDYLIDRDNNSNVLNLINELTNYFEIEKDSDTSNKAASNAKAKKSISDDFKFIPKKGVFEEYDDLKEDISRINEAADIELKKVAEILISNESNNKMSAVVSSEIKQVKFTQNTFITFEFEIPENLEKKLKNLKTSLSLELTGKRAGYKKFITPMLKRLADQLENKKEELERSISRFNIFLFQKFAEKREILDELINRISVLDCICSISVLSLESINTMTRPELDASSEKLKLNIKEGYHPCLINRVKSFVKNDITIDGENNMIIITGPNMGGKSTLLRQVCICAILAQVGCYVPAEYYQANIIDRIFTRIGAKDELLKGKSTFFVEMEEVKVILEQCTKQSLVIIDELGRGTSTEDGQKIAKSVIKYLINNSNPRTFLTTHYHEIIEWCRKLQCVKLFFMDSDVDSKNHDIKFLYKFIEGVCPDSFGLHVAKLAGVNSKILNYSNKYLIN